MNAQFYKNVEASPIESLTSRRPANMPKLLRAIGSVRMRRGLTADEVLIFLALGYLGLSTINKGVKAIAVSCAEISVLLRIPRETVRRKAARLVKKDLASITPHGIVVENIVEWNRLAEEFAA